MDIYNSEIVAIKDMAGGVRRFDLAIPPQVQSWDAGAHTHVALPDFIQADGPDRDLVRHMSICSLPEEGQLSFVTRMNRRPSVFKERLFQAVPGDKLALFKIGSCLPLPRDGRPLVMLTMGLAAATIRPLLLAASHDRQGIPEIISLTAATQRPFVFEEEFEQLQQKGNNLSAEAVSGRAALLDRLARLPRLQSAWIYVVGSELFIMDQIDNLRQLGVRDEQILLDRKPAKAAVYFKLVV
ncbi:FAD-dependent oxidoreductase [Oscillospiraceae bacterium HV4-5-C5C]|nr:FAD-dependent oxidoreductase [Oscillospiraceae bacterium HV4-5-C5C]